jgi:apolipoprotein N-acyltransferase
MPSPEDAGARPGQIYEARAYPVSWRIVAGALVTVSRTSLPLLALVVALADTPLPLLALANVVLLCALLPAAAAWLVERACTVGVSLHENAIVLARHGLTIEIPCSAIDRVRPWSVPLPGPGFSLQTSSGRRFGYGIEARDPTPILQAIAAVGGIAAARAALDHPTLAFASARSRRATQRWYHRVGKFVGFALLPTAVWFNAHQHIAYGGALGQYYLEGLGPYLETFAISYGLAVIYLVLYASLWRAVGEAAAWLTAWVAPSLAARVRRAVEVVCQVAYYAGVPLLVLLPFLA